MNVQFQVCGLCILLLLFVFYKSHRTLQLYREQIFFRVLCILIINLIFDISSIAMIYEMNAFPIWWVKFVCRFYLVSLIWVAYSPLMYVLSDLFSENKHKQVLRILTCCTIVFSVFPFLLPLYIYNKGSVVYTYGAAVVFVYAVAPIYMVSTLILIGVCHRKLNGRRIFAVTLWMIIWISSALIQFINNRLLIVGFAGAIGVLILFAVIENPEANLDRKLGCFNSYALTKYLKQLFEKKEEFGILDISFQNIGNLEDYDMDGNEIIIRILHMANTDRNLLVFKNITYGLVLLSKDMEKLKNTACELWEILADADEFKKQTKFILMPQTASFSNKDELFHFLSFVREKCGRDYEAVFEVNEEIISEYQRQYIVRQEIDTALAEDRVEVFLQPIYSNREECFTSAEALVRIRKEDGSLLSPGLFIPVAEESGQILSLGERVLEKVCEFLKNTSATELGIRYIEVNLSVVQCEKGDLAKRLIDIVERYQVNPGQIILEITETASIRARALLHENMRQLMEYGFSFALDDFGKGESNLMYIVEMPVSIVKLDYDMSKAFFTSPKAKHVVRAVIGMAHEMGLKLVAEGIETLGEKDSMGTEGIDYIQGYYYSKPLPMNEFLAFVKDYK